VGIVEDIVEEHKKITEFVKTNGAAITGIAALIIDALKKGNKILCAGNGGSAADSQHFSAEITGRFQKERRGFPGIALNADSAAMTAISNDYGYENVFARQLEALAKPGDIFVGFSTSGNSPNVVKAAEKAHDHGCSVIVFLGRDGGAMKSKCDSAFVVPSSVTARIQEAHSLAYHIICEIIDNAF
jgi:D-sedoheptulose 7-phosphate isomerase